jgi:hypothetical protein
MTTAVIARASEAIQTVFRGSSPDCFGALLLAAT